MRWLDRSMAIASAVIAGVNRPIKQSASSSAAPICRVLVSIFRSVIFKAASVPAAAISTADSATWILPLSMFTLISGSLILNTNPGAVTLPTTSFNTMPLDWSGLDGAFADRRTAKGKRNTSDRSWNEVRQETVESVSDRLDRQDRSANVTAC